MGRPPLSSGSVKSHHEISCQECQPVPDEDEQAGLAAIRGRASVHGTRLLPPSPAPLSATAS